MTTQRIGFWLGPALFALALLLPAPARMEPAAWLVAGLVGWVAAWWITEALPLAFPAYVLAYAYTDFLDHPGWVQTSLRELRAQLPATTALWVGGACTALHQWPLPGISAVQHLSGLQPLVAQWRHAH